MISGDKLVFAVATIIFILFFISEVTCKLI